MDPIRMCYALNMPSSTNSNDNTSELQELRARAKELSIPGYTKLNAEQLERAIFTAEELDWDLEHYRHEHIKWSRGGLPRGSGLLRSLERAARLSGTAGSLLIAEAAMEAAGRIGGSQVAAHGFRISRQLRHERKLVQILMRQPLSSVSDLLTHRGPSALINGTGHSARHHDSAWLEDAAHGNQSARRKMLQERMQMLGLHDEEH